MEVLLDRTEHEKSGIFNWKKIVLFTGLFILLGGMGYWFGGRYPSRQSSKLTGINAERTQELRKSGKEVGESLSSEKNRENVEVDRKVSKKDEPQVNISEFEIGLRPGNRQTTPRQIPGSNKDMTRQEGGVRKNGFNDNPFDTAKEISGNQSRGLEITSKNQGTEKSTEKLETLESLGARAIDTENLYETEVLSPRKLSTTKPLLKGKGLGFRLIFSPDFSFVPSYGLLRMGHNLGGLLEYRMNSRWSVQAGVLKSQKYYLTDPDQYPWPERWGERPSQLNRIDASCNMMDFPVNVRYNFTQGRSNVFGQVGLTSYLMMKEKYDYVYESSYTTNVYMSWEGKTGFYSLGELNLSGGLEMQLNRNLNVQFEPFLKVPLQRVGYGSVKVGTFGMFISTRIPIGSGE